MHQCHKGDDIMIRRPVYELRGGYGRRNFACGRGFGVGCGMGRGLGMRLVPNLSSFCRFDPSRPSRRAMFFNAQYNQKDMPSDIEILKNQAQYLKDELDAINMQLDEIEDRN
jgi:hypothetical protein